MRPPAWLVQLDKQGCRRQRTCKLPALPRACCTCRRRLEAADAGASIVDGQKAQKGRYPWLAKLHYNDRDKTPIGCGGSLIDPSARFVVTGAHAAHRAGAEGRHARHLRAAARDLAPQPDRATHCACLLRCSCALRDQ